LDTRQIQRRAGSIRAAIKPFRLLEKLCQSTRIKLPDKRLVTQEREIEMGFYSLLLGLARIRHRVPLASTPPGIPGTPPIFWLGDVNRNTPPILLRTFGYSKPILVALGSLSLKPISFGYKTPPIRFSQAGGQSALPRHCRVPCLV